MPDRRYDEYPYKDRRVRGSITVVDCRPVLFFGSGSSKPGCPLITVFRRRTVDSRPSHPSYSLHRRSDNRARRHQMWCDSCCHRLCRPRTSSAHCHLDRGHGKTRSACRCRYCRNMCCLPAGTAMDSIHGSFEESSVASWKKRASVVFRPHL